MDIHGWYWALSDEVPSWRDSLFSQKWWFVGSRFVFVGRDKHEDSNRLIVSSHDSYFSNFHIISSWKSWSLRYCGQVNTNSASRSTSPVVEVHIEVWAQSLCWSIIVGVACHQSMSQNSFSERKIKEDPKWCPNTSPKWHPNQTEQE